MKEDLIEKLNKELEDYKLMLKEKGVDYAIDRAYEITVKQEIIDSIEYDQDLYDIEVKRLLEINEMYDDWIRFDGNMRETIGYSVENTIEKINAEFEKEKNEVRQN